jgi:hypothetical protein
MADFIEKKGLGQDIDASQVNLGVNDLAKLSRIRNVDPRSGYGGLGIQQAQELTSDLPQAADLGLVLEQNKQLQAAGGRGYAGNVHNLQGEQTPFEQLTASIAASQNVPQPSGIQTGGIQSSNPAWQPQEPGGGGDRTSYDRDLGTLGAFGKSALESATTGLGMKGLTGAGLATAVGAPLGMAAKFGLTSMLSPLGILMSMGNQAYSGALDMSHDQAARAEGIDVGNLDMAGMKSVTEKGFHPGFMGYDQEFDYQNIQEEMERASVMDRVSMAIDAAIKGPEGGWTASTDIDPVTGLHKGQLANDPMGISKALGLDASFGGDGNDGSGGGTGGGIGGGGSVGGGDEGNTGGFGGTSGGYGDFGSDEGSGMGNGFW